MTRKLLILTSSTGGGHDMRAAALQAWATTSRGWTVAVHQALEGTHPLYAFGVGVYNLVQRTLPLAHHVYFNALELARLHASDRAILGAARFLAEVEAFAPDLVVSTHAHLNHGFFELVRRCLGRERVRCVTYCGELWGGYGFSQHWVNPDADGFIGAVGPCREQALALGMSPQKAVVGGFLLRPQFYAEPGLPAGVARPRPDGPPAPEHESQDSARVERRALLEDELELNAAARTVLLSTGAVGANNHLALLHCLEARRRPLQVIALCGRREGVAARIRSWAAGARYVTVRALPRRDDMPSLMRSVDLMVARPGTGTTSEAILCGTPLVFNCIGGVMPQEYLTLKFARHRGLGRAVYWPADLARFLDAADRFPATLERMQVAAAGSRPRQHPGDILDHLERLAPG